MSIEDKKYVFSDEDWFGNNIVLWEKYLSKYKHRDDVSYLEVGVYEGRSFVWILDNILTGDGSHATAVDPLYDTFDTFNNNLIICGKEKNVTVHKNISHKVLKNLRETSYDIIYIDGSHKSKDILHDLVLCWELLKQDGILIIDDYLWKKDEAPINTTPKIAVDSFITIYSDELELLYKDYQVFIRKNINSLYHQNLVLINDNFYFWDTNIFGKFDCSLIDYNKLNDLFKMYDSFEKLAANLPTHGVLSVKYISDEDKNVLKRYLNSLKYGQDKPDISIFSEDEQLILNRLMS